jgi:hypothetical protein
VVDGTFLSYTRTLALTYSGWMSFRLACCGGFFSYVIVMPAAPDWTGDYGERQELVNVYRETSTHLPIRSSLAPLSEPRLARSFSHIDRSGSYVLKWVHADDTCQRNHFRMAHKAAIIRATQAAIIMLSLSGLQAPFPCDTIPQRLCLGPPCHRTSA